MSRCFPFFSLILYLVLASINAHYLQVTVAISLGRIEQLSKMWRIVRAREIVKNNTTQISRASCQIDTKPTNDGAELMFLHLVNCHIHTNTPNGEQFKNECRCNLVSVFLSIPSFPIRWNCSGEKSYEKWKISKFSRNFAIVYPNRKLYKKWIFRICYYR